MPKQNVYPTGADTDIYLTRDPYLSGASGSAFGAMFGQKDPLDVTGMVYMEEGDTVPLYNFARQFSEHKVHTRRMVSGSLEFNYSEDHMNNHRTPQLQNMRGSTLWIVQKRLEYRPTPSIKRDIIRISSVYERPFRHEAQPYAKETVPFIGRNATLVRRESRTIDTGELQDFAEEGGEFRVDGDDLIADTTAEITARVEYVVDGDTYVVTPLQLGKEIDVRLVGADTPETSKEGDGSYSNNRDGMADYRWPSDAPTRNNDPSQGEGGSSPTSDQLDAWGDYATSYMRDRIGGQIVTLKRDPSTSKKDDFDRYLFQVRYAGQDMGAELVDKGYARVAESLTTSVVGGGYANRREKLMNLHDAAQQEAGTSSASGIFYSFDVDTWKNEK